MLLGPDRAKLVRLKCDLPFVSHQATAVIIDHRSEAGRSRIISNGKDRIRWLRVIGRLFSCPLAEHA